MFPLDNRLPSACSGRFVRSTGSAFTIIEMLVAMAVLMLICGILISTLGETSKVWQSASDKVGSFQAARLAIERITRNLSQSTLNISEGYDNPSKPTKRIRKSDLHFVVDTPPVPDFGQGNAIFFQAPLGKTDNPAAYSGLSEMLNSVGYYVTYGEDQSLPPFLKTLDRRRFRLMQYLDPAEDMSVYRMSGKQWYTTNLANRSVVLANDVILLLFWPRLATKEDADGNDLTSSYTYDSRLPAAPAAQAITTNQQPPLVQVTMVAIDERSANRLENSSNPPNQITSALTGLFKTSTETQYKIDLATLEQRLTAQNIGYRVLTTTVPIRASKWNKN